VRICHCLRDYSTAMRKQSLASEEKPSLLADGNNVLKLCLRDPYTRTKSSNNLSLTLTHSDTGVKPVFMVQTGRRSSLDS